MSIIVSTSAINFGKVIVDKDKTVSFSVFNTSGYSVDITLASSEGQFTTIPSSDTIPSNSNRTITAKFIPTHTGAFSGTITISNDDPSDPADDIITVSGEGVRPTIHVSPRELNYETLLATQDKSSSEVYVVNTSNFTLDVSNVVSDESSFYATPTTFNITPYGNQILTVTFEPHSTGDKTGSLSIFNNSSNDSTAIVDMTGSAEIPTIYVDKTSIDYGIVTVNETVSEYVTIRNDSTSNINLIGNISVTNPRFSSSLSSFTLGKDETANTRVDFTPLNTTDQSGSLVIESNDFSSGDQTVGLYGKGLLASNIEVSTTSISFGNVSGGRDSTESFTIYNRGVLDLITTQTIDSTKFSTVSDATISPSSSSLIDVVYYPDSAVIDTATLTINSNDPDTSSLSIYLDGTGVHTIDTTNQIDFGLVLKNSTLGQNFSVSNIGSVPLTISGMIADSTVFSVTSSFPSTIASGQSRGYNISATPDVLGDITGNLSILSDDFLSPTTFVSLEVTGSTPTLSTVSQINFGNVSVNDSSNYLLSVSNTGPFPLTISGMSPDNPVFSVTSSFPSTINSGQYKNYGVSVSPNSLGDITGTLSISSDDFNNPVTNISLDSTGVTPSLSTVSQIDFGDVSIDDTSIQSFSITNTGSVSLTISGMTTDSSVFSATSSFPSTINSSQTKNYNISVTPVTLGDATGILSISSDDFNNPTTNIDLEVTGRPLEIDTTGQINFGTVLKDSTSYQSFSVRNAGITSLTISGMTTDNSVFSVTSSFPSTIAGGQTKNYNISAAPNILGDTTGNLSIASNATYTPVKNVGLSVEGASPVIDTTSQIDFGTVPKDISMSRSFAVSNTGPVSLTISDMTTDNSVFSAMSSFPSTIDSDQTKYYDISATPDVLGDTTGILSIISNDFNIPVKGVGLRVEGLVQPSDGIIVSTLNIDFGKVIVDQTKSDSFTVFNTAYYTVDVDLTSSNSRFSTVPSSYSLPGNSNRVFTAKFIPDDMGPFSGTISISNDDPVHSEDDIITVSGEGVRPTVSISPKSLHFGDLSIQDSTSTSVYVVNTSEFSLSVTNVLSDESSFYGSPSSLNISAYNTATINVKFEPSTAGLKTGTLQIINNSSNDNVSIIDMTGQAYIPVISVDKTSINYGIVTVNETVSDYVKISNDSTDSIKLIGSISSTNPRFNSSVSNFILEKDETRDVRIDFTPLNTTDQSGSLVIQSNDINSGDQTVSLYGKGLLASNIEVSTDHISFGDVIVNRDSTESFTVQNNGVLNLYLTNTIDSTLFSTVYDATILPGGSQLFDIVYYPDYPRNNTATLTINSNDPDTPQFYVSLDGTGRTPIIDTTNQIDFGYVLKDSTASQNFSVYNTGPVTLTITDMTSDSSDFYVTDTFPSEIVSSSSKQYTVESVPSSFGDITGTLNIKSNDFYTPTEAIALNTTGSSPIIDSSSEIDFGPVLKDSTSIYSFVVSNTGNVPLTITDMSTNNAVFFVTDSFPSIIDSNQNKDFSVMAVPPVLGEITGTMTIESNDFTTPSKDIDLSVIGAVPITGFSVQSHDFGVVTFGSKSEQIITVSNTGGVALEVYSVVSSNSRFSVSTSKFTVQPSSSFDFVVTFRPEKVEREEGVISLTTNDPTNPFTIIVSGKGAQKSVEKPPPAPVPKPKNEWGQLSFNDSFFILDGVSSVIGVLDKGLTAVNKIVKALTKILKFLQLFISAFNSFSSIIQSFLTFVKNQLNEWSSDILGAGVYMNVFVPPAFIKTLTGSPQWGSLSQGGFDGFLGKLKVSLYNTADPNRPVFDKEGVVGGMIVVVDTESLDDFFRGIEFLGGLFSFIDLFPLHRTLPPPVNIRSSVGFFEQKDKSVKYGVKLEWDAPPITGFKLYRLTRSLKEGGVEKVVDYLPTKLIAPKGSDDIGLLEAVIRRIFGPDKKWPTKTVKLYNDKNFNKGKPAYPEASTLNYSGVYYDFDVDPNNPTTYYYRIQAGWQAVFSYQADEFGGMWGEPAPDVSVTTNPTNCIEPNQVAVVDHGKGKLEPITLGFTSLGSWVSIQTKDILPFLPLVINVLNSFIDGLNGLLKSNTKSFTDFLNALVEKFNAYKSIVEAIATMIIALENFFVGTPTIGWLIVPPKSGGTSGFLSRVLNAKRPLGGFSGKSGITMGVAFVYGYGVSTDAFDKADADFEAQGKIIAKAFELMQSLFTKK